MSLLLGRKAILTVGSLQINSLDLSFTVKKTLKPSPNTADIKVWNLSEDHRNSIEEAGSSTVQLEVGYQDGTSVIFLGDLLTSTASEYSGPDVISQIGGGDGAKKFQTARVAVSHAKGTSSRTVLQSLVKALGVLPGNSDAAISAIQSAGAGDFFTLGTVLSGSASREMTRLLRAVGYTWSIQAGALQMIPVGKATAGTALSLNQKTGLIGSPSIDKDGILSCRSLIVPDAFPGKVMVLTSKRITGQFIIQETSHNGERSGQSWYIDYKAKRY